MDAISFKSVIGEFLGTLLQSMSFTAMLCNKSKQYNIALIIATVAITFQIFYYWTSVRLNPFISLGVTLTQDNPDWIRLLTDVVAQIAGGIAGVYLASKMFHFDLTVNKEEEEYVTANRLWTILSDAIFTFVLVFSYMVLVSDFKQGLLIGIGIALVYTCSLTINKGYSGGNINYAQRLGTALATRDMSNLFVYTIGPIVGAVIAVCTWHMYTNKFAGLFSGCAPVVPNPYPIPYRHEFSLEHEEAVETPLTEDVLPQMAHTHTLGGHVY